MYQFYIIEIKKYPNGEYEHNVDWAYDANPDLAAGDGQIKSEASNLDT